MREIKFRGKRTNNGEWVCGFYWEFYKDEKSLSVIRTQLIDEANVPVEPETVGQYTGLKDRNGVEIYEGDIVKVSDFGGKHRIGKVKYYIDNCCYRIVGDLFNYALILSQEDIEVIGNIYDTPELLEEEQ